ncbi:MAG: nucleoside deaminase [Bacteroidetes bacterium]|nr:MAG: nucleoside deaminase [Bacteroidota bacterium]
METFFDDAYFMGKALQAARRAWDEDEIPVGAVVVQQHQIIGQGYNQTERLHDVTAHAEMIAVTAACNFLNAKYLPQATLYVTLEPCLMCAGALYWCKIGRIVYGAADVKNGYSKHFSAASGAAHPFHPKTTVVQGVESAACAALMSSFFKKKRFK